MTHRVQHTETKAKGTVTGEFVVPADRGGDCHGLWYRVDFDDGRQASVPAVLTERIAAWSEDTRTADANRHAMATARSLRGEVR